MHVESANEIISDADIDWSSIRLVLGPFSFLLSMLLMHAGFARELTSEAENFRQPLPNIPSLVSSWLFGFQSGPVDDIPSSKSPIKMWLPLFKPTQLVQSQSIVHQISVARHSKFLLVITYQVIPSTKISQPTVEVRISNSDHAQAHFMLIRIQYRQQLYSVCSSKSSSLPRSHRSPA